MPLDVGVFAYEGVPIELAQAAASELERALDFVDLRAHVEPLSVEQGKTLGVEYKEWTPPVVKNPLRLNLTEGGGRMELMKKLESLRYLQEDNQNEDISERARKHAKSEIEFRSKNKHLKIIAGSNVSEEETFKKYVEEIKIYEEVKRRFQELFPGEYSHLSVIERLKRAAEIYGLTEIDMRDMESCIVFEESSKNLVAIDLLQHYKKMRHSEIKIINGDPSASRLSNKECILFPFISMFRGGIVSEQKSIDLSHYTYARGLVTVANNQHFPSIGEAVYFLNKGKEQIAKDWATYCLIHEFGGHTIGGISDLSDHEYESRWDVMRAPLNALTLQKEIEQYGRDARLRFRPEDRARIAENVKANYVA